MKNKDINVLLIEDNLKDVRYIGELLDDNFDLICFETLAQGITRLSEGDIDVILLDLSLPDSRGIETFFKTQSQSGGIPIIVLTGLNDESQAVKAVRDGAQDYLIKGHIDNNLLERALRYAIERKRAETALHYRVEIEKLITTISTNFINLAPDKIDSAINQALQRIGEFVSVDRCYVFQFSDNGFKMDNTHEWCANGIEPQIQKLKGLMVGAYPWFKEKITNLETIHIPRVEDLPSEAKAEKEEYQSKGIQSLINVPIVWRGSLVGFLGIESDRYEKIWREEDIRLLKMIGEIFMNALERKRAEVAIQESNLHLEEAIAELKATQKQILHQERLRALGEMASGIAHDFNNALSPILSFSEMLLMHPNNLDDKEKVTRYLIMMNTAAKDAANVVSRLREFYRNREEGEIYQTVDVNNLVEQAISITQPKWKDEALAEGKMVKIEKDLLDVPPIAGSEADLREVLTNLIFNAVDAIPQNGTVTLRTRPDGEHVILEISDSGTGMTEEIRQHCMDPFFTTKDKRGTGFGLAIIYSIIQRHKGTIEIDSEWEKGTTFIIHLPAQKEHVVEGKSQEAQAPSRALHVLVVEDEPLVCEGVIEYLVGDGHTVETASNGREGLERFQAGRFDIVLTDRAMPGMSGDQLASAIKEIEPSKPIILLTGFGDMMKDIGDNPKDVDFILNKPVTLTGLRQALAKVTEVSLV
jgi:signal transduction histidine kinase/DNA-binding response OmpR family regulator